MLKRNHTFLSAIFTAVLLTAFVFFSPQSAAACAEPPATLLRLYLHSQLIVIADFHGDEPFVVESDDEYGSWGTIQRNLSVVRVIRGGTDLERLSFQSYEWKPKLDETATDGTDEEMHEYDFGMKEVELRPGGRYLFFLNQAEDEENEFYLADDYTGIKEISGKYSINLERLEKLQEIATSKEVQIGQLTEWLVTNIEDPITRYDGLSDLTESFYALKYEEDAVDPENPEQEVRPFALDENFTTYSPALAESLTDSQKSRISSVLFSSIQEAWFGGTSEQVDYSLTFMVGFWERPRLALYGYNMLQSLDPNDQDKKLQVMEFISNIVEDESLSSAYYEYYEVHHAIAEQMKSDVDVQEELKANIAKRDELIGSFDQRFQFMYGRNFEPETEQAVNEEPVDDLMAIDQPAIDQP